MKQLPIGIQTFSELRKRNCVYIDKTKHIYDLISKGKYYFLARPRRFGKSLLVSTLAEIFAGNKQLFEGLAMYGLPYEWKKHPVITISFSDIPCANPEELLNGIKFYLRGIAKKEGIEIHDDILPGQMLQLLVQELAAKEKVVLLIDEYDYPIIKHIHHNDVALKMREILKNFYIIIKGLDPYLEFVLLTGVSKFSKTSIFSGLNNLNDISLDARYNELLGYTRNEIKVYLHDYVESMAQHMNSSIDELIEKITTWYDGYLFSRDNTAQRLYNPFSVMLCLDKNEFANYWFDTGTPTFLINLLKLHNYPMQDFENVQASSEELGQFEVDDIELKTLMFQTGYLAIKGYDNDRGNYILGYANKETMDSLCSFVMKSMANMPGSDYKNLVYSLAQTFIKQDFKHMFVVLTQLFAAIPYTIQIDKEKYYQTIFYLMLKMLGANIMVEQSTNIGCIDAVLQTKDICFIIEFKINSTTAKAMRQIKEKKYYQPYLLLGKKIMLVGISFDTEARNVSNIEGEELLPN